MTNKNQKRYYPSHALAGLKESFSKDALSGFLIFLLALPLSLSIANACPAIFEFATAIIGSIVFCLFAHHLFISKEPADRLIAINCGVFKVGYSGWHLALEANVLSVSEKLFKSNRILIKQNKVVQTLTVNSGLIFTNIFGFKKVFATLLQGKNNIIDLSIKKIVNYISSLTVNNLVEYYNYDGENINVKGFENHKQLAYFAISTSVLRLS